MVLSSAFGADRDPGGGAVGRLVEDPDVPGSGRRARIRSARVGHLVAVGADQRHEPARSERLGLPAPVDQAQAGQLLAIRGCR